MSDEQDSEVFEGERSDGASEEVPSGVAAAGAARPHEVAPPSVASHPPYRFLSVTVFSLLGLLAMAGVKSYRDLAAARDIESHLQHEISATQTRIQALTEHIDRIENDPATLERLAREDLGMVREGDIVIVLPEDLSAADAVPSAASLTGSKETEASLTVARD